MLKRKYDFVGNPQHGLIKVIRNKKYGFVDINMKIVIPLEYDWSSSFCRIKLYGKQYIGAYVSRGGYKTIIAMDGTTIIHPFADKEPYFIINDKLWVKKPDGYILMNRKGSNLLETTFQNIINDRVRQPRNVYLVQKNGRYGGIHISRNNMIRDILPFDFQSANFWYCPGCGIFLECQQNGKKGLYNIKGRNVIPCIYDSFTYATPFRKSFILAHTRETNQVDLYDGVSSQAIYTSSWNMWVEYAFTSGKQIFYSVYSLEKELLLDGDGKIRFQVDRRKGTSIFCYLMMQQEENFRYRSLNAVLRFFKEIKKGKKVSKAEKEEAIIYGYFFLEQQLHQYSVYHDLPFVHCKFHDAIQENERFWGVCFHNEKVISLNVELLLHGFRFIKQVLLHELAHLKYSNHSKYFFAYLSFLLGSDVHKERNYSCDFSFLMLMDANHIVKQRKKDLYETYIKNNSSYIHTIQPVLSKYSPFLSVTDDDTLATVAMKVKNIEEEK